MLVYRRAPFDGYEGEPKNRRNNVLPTKTHKTNGGLTNSIMGVSWDMNQ